MFTPSSLSPIREVHYTIASVSDEAVKRFKDLCITMGVKVITVDNGARKVSQHVMTSTVVNGQREFDTHIDRLEWISDKCKVDYVRRKVEMPPRQEADMVTGKEYFEVHVLIRTHDLQSVCYDKAMWFVSSNLAKTPNELGKSFMLTARAYDTHLSSFVHKYQQSMQSFAGSVDPACKTFVEKCIYDTCAELDDDWMGQEAQEAFG